MATRGSSLLDQPVLLVHQRAKLFEVRNQYQLMDGAGQPVGVVEQVNQSPLAVFSRIFSTSTRRCRWSCRSATPPGPLRSR